MGRVRRSTLRRISEAQRVRTAEWKRVTRCRAESVEYVCEARVEGVCDGYGAHGHHVIRRSQGGPDTQENCRWVCRSCHRHLHDHVEWAVSAGLLKSAPAPGLWNSTSPRQGPEQGSYTPGGIPVVYTADPLAWAASYGVAVWSDARGV